MTVTQKKNTNMQARGVKRRELIICAAMELLKEKALDKITLVEVAKRAGIPTGSVYHFYQNVNQIYASVGQRFTEELEQVVSAPYSMVEASCWQNIMRTSISRSVAFYNERPDYRQLIIGENSPVEIKSIDRLHDESLGIALIAVISRYYNLPKLPRMAQIFYYSVEIVDLMFSLSQVRDGTITAEMEKEAQIAMIAYLRSYLPEILPEAESN